MTKFLNLLEFELRRAKSWFLALLAFQVIAQVIYLAHKTISSHDHLQSLELINLFDDSPLYTTVIGALFFGFAIYCFYTWFREWRGQGSFIYRLMTLPGSRMSVVWAKLVAVFLMLFALLLVQLLLIIGANALVDLLSRPKGFQILPWYYAISQMRITALILPVRFADFILTYAVGMNWVLAVFTGTLLFLNRPNIKGIVLGIGYFIVFVLVSALIFSLTRKLYMTRNEQIVLFICCVVLATIIQTWLIRRELVGNIEM